MEWVVSDVIKQCLISFFYSLDYCRLVGKPYRRLHGVSLRDAVCVSDALVKPHLELEA